jgi:hypothetical protein
MGDRSIIKVDKGSFWQVALRDDVTQMTDAQTVECWSFVDLAAKALSKRAKVLRSRVVEVCASLEGVASTAKTKQHFFANDCVVNLTMSEAVSVNDAALLAVLRERGIETEACFDQVWKLNDARLEQLIAGGTLTPDDLERITVKKSSTRLAAKAYPHGLTVKSLLEGE